MPRAGKMKECSRRPRETDHVSTTCGEAHYPSSIRVETGGGDGMWGQRVAASARLSTARRATYAARAAHATRATRAAQHP